MQIWHSVCRFAFTRDSDRYRSCNHDSDTSVCWIALVWHCEFWWSDALAIIVVQYELYELCDWGKVPELYGTLQWTWNFMELLRILSFATLDNLSSLYIRLLRFLSTTRLSGDVMFSLLVSLPYSTGHLLPMRATTTLDNDLFRVHSETLRNFMELFVWGKSSGTLGNFIMGLMELNNYVGNAWVGAVEIFSTVAKQWLTLA